jgi:hypothetical protein
LAYLSERQLDQRKRAGKAAYRALILRALRAHPDDLDLAARFLTGARRALGFWGTRGVTRAYMQKWRDLLLGGSGDGSAG